ncbi:MAG: penicillin-binding protein activator [Alphaproteobacteria bacterium]|nr:penicillin-binding protein activator [Alphaproteobacteria bacterium]MBN2779880.1 penicillin-binding protein activator [Alphaproteobacteria bacterium]
MRFMAMFSVLFLFGCAQTITPREKPKVLSAPVETGTTFIPGETWQSTQVRHDSIVNVGLMLPLSGRASVLGQDMKKAVEMALYQSKPTNLKLNVYDTASSEAGARMAAMRAKADGVEMVLGPVFSKHVEIVSKELDVPIFSFTTDEGALGRGVYSFGMTTENQLTALFDHAKLKGKKRLGLLLPSSFNGKKMAEQLTHLSRKKDLELTKVSYYPTSDLKNIQTAVKDFSYYDVRKEQMKNLCAGQSEAMKEKYKHVDTWGDFPYDMIFVGGNGSDLESVVSFLRYFELDPKQVQYLGTSVWDEKGNKTLARTQAWVAGFNHYKQDNFSRIFKAQYGHDPKSLAILAFDAMTFASFLAKDGSISRYEILDQNGYNGASGLFRFKENGVIEYGLEIKELSPGEESKVIQPAQRKF